MSTTASSEPDVGPSAKSLGKRRAISSSPPKRERSQSEPEHLPLKRLRKEETPATAPEDTEESDSDVVLVSGGAKESDLTPLYSVTCPICLGNPQSMVVTRMGTSYTSPLS
jgi:hypothetical protein